MGMTFEEFLASVSPTTLGTHPAYVVTLAALRDIHARLEGTEQVVGPATQAERSRQHDLWTLYQSAQNLHNEAPSPRMFVAANAIEKQYLEEFGHHVPLGWRP